MCSLVFLPQGGVSEADRNMMQTSLSQSDHSVVVDTLLHNAIKSFITSVTQQCDVEKEEELCQVVQQK